VSGTAAERLVEEKARINAVQQALLAELGKIGLAEHCPGITAAFDAAEIRIDPFDQSESLQCYWKTPLGMNQGTVQL
ncbi:hypothetical protein Q4595_31155, partial [Wenyingzhuangia sp. 1_MG-2023]|nr:hypothetical protein [Wenyingzhuangia sp. 1_MG-2023]